jgi:anti-sigma-K factor RskA
MEITQLDMRLTNLENSVKEIIEMVSILPRLEERMISQKTNLEDHEARLRNLEKNQSRNNMFSSWIERIVIVAITLTLAGGFKILTGA